MERIRKEPLWTKGEEEARAWSFGPLAEAPERVRAWNDWRARSRTRKKARDLRPDGEPTIDPVRRRNVRRLNTSRPVLGRFRTRDRPRLGLGLDRSENRPRSRPFSERDRDARRVLVLDLRRPGLYVRLDRFDPDLLPARSEDVRCRA